MLKRLVEVANTVLQRAAEKQRDREKRAETRMKETSG